MNDGQANGMTSRGGLQIEIPAFINVKLAKRYIQSGHRIDISRALGISESAECVLSACTRPLPFDEIEILSDPVARALSRHRT